MSDTCGVDEAEIHAAQCHTVFYGIACGAVYVADDGFVVVKQLVEEGGFAHIGLTDDCHGYAVSDGVACVKTVGEAADGSADFLRQRDEFCAVGELHVLLAEVEFQLQKRGHLKQAVAQTSEFPAEATPHLAHRQTVGGHIGGCDKVGHGFSLTQVHFAIEEGAFGELAGLGIETAVVEQQLHDLLEYKNGTMARYLHTVLSRVGMWLAEYAHQHIVKQLSVICHDVAVSQRLVCVVWKFAA